MNVKSCTVTMIKDLKEVQFSDLLRHEKTQPQSVTPTPHKKPKETYCISLREIELLKCALKSNTILFCVFISFYLSISAGVLGSFTGVQEL